MHTRCVMQPVVNHDLVAWCISQSVCHTRLRCAKRLNGSTFCLGWMLLENHTVLDVGPNPPMMKAEKGFDAAFAKLLSNFFRAADPKCVLTRWWTLTKGA